MSHGSWRDFRRWRRDISITQQTIWQVLLTRESSLDAIHHERNGVMVENTRVSSRIVAAPIVLNEKLTGNYQPRDWVASEGSAGTP
jgi:hypothetical protein